jgi:hypothetical protein
MAQADVCPADGLQKSYYPMDSQNTDLPKKGRRESSLIYLGQQ